MPTAKITININKSEVIADIDEVKAKLVETEAMIDRICEKARYLTDTIKRVQSDNEE